MNTSAKCTQSLMATVAFTAIAFPSAAWAAQVATSKVEAPAEQGDETAKTPLPVKTDDIIVTGARTFLSANTSGTTGLPLAIEKVPQSISLVSSDFIRTVDLKTAGQVANYVPGALNAGSREALSSQTKLRGFVTGKAVDGFIVDENFDPDYATVERLEVVKGPSSVVYGNSFSGGLINRVSKGAGPNTPSYISLQGGSFGEYRAEGQFATALDADGHMRLIAIGIVAGGDSFYDVIKHRDYVAYAGLNLDYGNVTGFVHGGYERHRRTAFDGIPTLPDGTIAPVPRSFFIGSPKDQNRNEVFYTNSNINWQVTDLLQIGIKGQYEQDRLRAVIPYASGLQVNGDMSISNDVVDPNIKTSYGFGIVPFYKLDALGLKDSFITAAVLYQGFRQYIVEPRGSGRVNIFAGEAAITAAFDAIVNGTATARPLKQDTLTFSAQSVLKPTDSISVLIGASHSTVKIRLTQNNVTQNFDPKPNMSYRAGLTWEVVKNLNLYGSYSESFLPQRRVDIAGNVLAPVSGSQYEIGAKYRGYGGKLLLTAAAYDIKQSNTAQFDQTLAGVDRYRAAGRIGHKGIELEAVGKLTPQWQIVAGYSYLSAKILNDTNTAIVGKRELFLPNNTYSLYTTYTLSGSLAGLTFGGGVHGVDSQPTSYTRTTKDIPAYTVVDASISYDRDKWSARLNFSNVFDKFYYLNNYDTLFYGNSIGAPRSVTFTVARGF